MSFRFQRWNRHCIAVLICLYSGWCHAQSLARGWSLNGSHIEFEFYLPLDPSAATNAANYRLISPLGSELSNPRVDKTGTRVTLDVTPPLLMYNATVSLTGIVRSPDGDPLDLELSILVHDTTAVSLQTGEPLG